MKTNSINSMMNALAKQVKTTLAVGFLLMGAVGCAAPLRNYTWEDFRPANVPVELEAVDGVQTANYEAQKDTESIQRRLTYRYSDAKSLQMLSSMTYERAVNMYRESSQMVAGRHIAPKSYAERTSHALKNLIEALDNPAFLKATKANTASGRADQVKAQLAQVADSYQPQNVDDALRVMNWAASTMNQSLGISPAAVALEFTHGSIDALDKYSAIVPSNDPLGRSTSLNEEIVGIGAELKQHDNGAQVVRPLQGSPAERSGLQKGDIITSVNGTSLAGKDLTSMADMIKGPAGTRLLLNVQRGNSQTMITVIRARIELKSVSEVRMVQTEQGSKVGYIRIDKFAEDTTQLLDEGLWKLHREGMQSLVVDVRGNPGGLLTTAISVSDRFLPKGTIVSTKGRTQSDQMHEAASFARTWKVPMIVLVDGNSASASEIFAAAIQENGRGLVVGEKSYGKGTVQTHFPMRSISGNLKLTTALFYSPTGRKMSGEGVIPDVTVTTGEEVAVGEDEVMRKALEIAEGTQLSDLLANLLSPIAGLATGSQAG